jgi:hypothetical protein
MRHTKYIYGTANLYYLPDIKGKGKVAPVIFFTEHHAMKAYWGSGGIAPLVI